jgi:hypothetical protein
MRNSFSLFLNNLKFLMDFNPAGRAFYALAPKELSPLLLTSLLCGRTWMFDLVLVFMVVDVTI